MPNLESCLDAVGDALYISVTDILSAFRQLPVAAGHVDRTAFVTPRDKYCFMRMPFGVANAPWLFQHVMSLALGHRGPDSGIRSCMDDLICINNTFKSHLVSLKKMFEALHVAGLTLKPSKIQFGQKEVDYLGHVISAKERYFRQYRPHQCDSRPAHAKFHQRLTFCSGYGEFRPSVCQRLF